MKHLKDNELLNYLTRTENDILPYIEVAREIGIDKLYLAKYPDIPSIFQKVKCPKCGKLLQNHLIILE